MRGGIARSLAALWRHLGGDVGLIDAVEVTGPEVVLGSRFAVTDLSVSTIGAALLALSELSARGKAARLVSVDARSAAAAFRSEALFQPIGWQRPPAWDPIAGDYRAKSGFIRLHTNYTHHRDAVLSVLGVRADRDAVAAAVAGWEAPELEAAVAAASGCAAALRSREEWLATEHGQATSEEPPVALSETAEVSPWSLPDSAAPLGGLRVLDLTRVIAGPTCTRLLAAYGADVLRVDPPGFQEVAALVPDVTVGKRCAAMDLREDSDRERFLELLSEADVLVTGYRPGALEGLGLDPQVLYARNPRLVLAQLDAWGYRGPMRARRGFDSLVQVSVGIAWDGPGSPPRPLPAQALDHGAGYLLAAGVGRALTELAAGRRARVRVSLLGVANHLLSLGPRDPKEQDARDLSDLLVACETAWGPAMRAPCPGALEAYEPRWPCPAGPIASLQRPVWAPTQGARAGLAPPRCPGCS